MVDELLAENSLTGDARYWRAFNEAEPSRFDEAWDDVDLADKQLVNAEVPELAGIRASTQPPEPQARQTRRREQQIASNRRMIVTSW